VQRRVKQRFNSQVNGMSADKRYYLTTPIYYVNDVPHIGHAYTTLACDVLARFKRLDGFDVHFLTGTDEHGQKVEKSAAAAGIEPQEFTDRVSQNFQDLADAMNYSHDDFIRTTEKRHIKASQAIWTRLKENGHIYLGSYAGWYAVRDEAFYDESELTEAEGGTKTAPSGAEVEWVEEPSYFFDLSKWQEPLLKFYEDNPDFIAPKSRRNEVMSFVKGGLRDLSISRTSFKWGVPVPGDPDHIMYVWLDALTNYLTAVGYPDESSDDYLKYWPTSLHMVGKDILRFHAVYWPAFLMGAGIDVPKRVFAHGWWTNEGQKISKSVGNIIDPNEIVDTYGLDQVRYFLMKEVPFGNDGDFSHRAIISRINSDLANDLGNLCQRVLSMIHKNCAAQVPACQSAGIEIFPVHGTLTDIHQALAKVRVHMDNQAFHEALEEIWRIIRDANRTVDESAPWALRKTDPEAMASVLYILAEIIRHFAILLQPFMPESCGKMLDQLAVPEDARGFEQLHNNSGTEFDENALSPGTPLPKPEGIFPRFIEVTIAE
jgi:methionyl-tRNA synthetase